MQGGAASDSLPASPTRRSRNPRGESVPTVERDWRVARAYPARALA